MSEATDTVELTFHNPDALNDIRELRKELHRVNVSVATLSGKLRAMNEIAHHQAVLIESMVDAHEANDHAGVRLQLQRLSEHRASFKAPKKPH